MKRENMILIFVLYFSLIGYVMTINALAQTPSLSVQKSVEQGVEKAATDKGIRLSPDARDSIIREILRSNIDKGVPSANDDTSLKDAEALIKPIANNAGRNEMINKSTADNAIVEMKMGKMELVIQQLVQSKTKTEDVQLTDEAQDLVKADMITQARRMAESGFSLEKMSERNTEYLAAFLNSTSKKLIGEDEYVFFKNNILLPTIVNLTLITSPDKAEVIVSGMKIGETPLQKPFESGKNYAFTLIKTGYKTTIKTYFVEEYPLTQQVEEVLLIPDN